MKGKKAAAGLQKAQQPAELLVELLVEEMPPRLVASLGEQFASGLRARLAEAGFADADAGMDSYATARRLAVIVSGCRSRVPARRERVRGPAWPACRDRAGRPTAALRGFASAHGCKPDQVGSAQFNGREHAVAVRRIAAKRLENSLGGIIEDAASAMSAPRLMRWGEGRMRFVRPVRSVLAMHAGSALSLSCFGLDSAAGTTAGHRALAAGRQLAVPSARSYQSTLARRHKVVVCHRQRCRIIEHQLADAAAPDRLIEDRLLVEENAAMTESPQVYAAGFGREFLQLPPQVIGGCLKKHMRCFALAGRGGRLASRFLLVADNRPRSPDLIVSGFERVVAARLADARFYWQADREEIAAGAHRKKLERLAYHPRLGSVAARIGRIERVAAELVRLGVFPAAAARLAARAAGLCKLDLATHVIGEYPQLEGIMAAHYFVRPGERRLADLVAGHLDADRDASPPDPAHWPLVVATEIERIAGLLAAGERLAADRDPHGLRRAATRLAVVLSRQPAIELRGLVSALVSACLAGEELERSVRGRESQVCSSIVEMVIDRIRNQAGEILGLERAPGRALVNAIIDPEQEQIRAGGYAGRIAALDAFLESRAGASLIAAHKRVANILRKSASAGGRAARLVAKEEIALAAAIDRTEKALDAAFAANDYRRALARLADLAAPVDRFFDRVMVNASDPALAAARLRLLARLGGQLNRVADLSRLSR